MVVVTEIKDLRQITLRDSGEQKEIRDIMFADDSNQTIKGTLWAEEAYRDDIAVGTIVAIRDCGLRDDQYMVGKTLSLPHGSGIIPEPTGEKRY